MTSKKSSSAFGASIIALSSLFYATYGVWTKLTGNFFDGYGATAIRSILAMVILVAIAFFYHKLEPLDLKKNKWYIVGMIMASLFAWGPYYYAILTVGIGISLSINYASLIISIFIFGWLLGGEKFTKVKALSATLGITGIALIFAPTISGTSVIALIAALVSGLAVGANTVLVKEIHYESAQSTIMLWATSSIANMLMVFILGKSYPIFKWQIEWLYLAFFAIASVIASWTLIRGLKLIDAGTAGILGLLEIVFGVIFGVILFHERPTIIVLVGMVIIILAAAIPYFKEIKSKQKPLI